MKVGIAISTVLLTVSPMLHGQSSPPATTATTPSSALNSGFVVPSMDGTIHYALGASQIVQYGYYGSGSTSGTASLNGDISYSSKSTVVPFNMIYAGGILFGESGGQGITTYQNLAASQSLITGKWVLNLSDSFSFLPQSPTTGLSGIPGVGDIGVPPIEGPSGGPAGGVLTQYGDRISNDLSGSVERLFTGRTSVSGSGSWTVLHFLNGTEGFDTSQVMGQAGLNHRIDARNTVSVNGVYSVYTFAKSENGLNFNTRGVNGVYTRRLNAAMSLSVSAGPQWLYSSDKTQIPDQLSAAANVGLTYLRGLTSASLNYTRGVNGGSGVQVGGLSDTVSGSVGHATGRDWLTTVTGSYTHTAGLGRVASVVSTTALPLTGNFSTVYGGVQVSRSLTRSLSAYVSYTALHQSYDATFIGKNAFNGTSHSFGVGISFAPRSSRLGQF